MMMGKKNPHLVGIILSWNNSLIQTSIYSGKINDAKFELLIYLFLNNEYKVIKNL